MDILLKKKPIVLSNIKIKIDMHNINFYFLDDYISILLPYLLLYVFQLYFRLELF